MKIVFLDKDTFQKPAEKFITYAQKILATSYLINTARAALVDKADLFAALKNKKIAGAAMDGYWSEPPEENDPMLSLDNFIVTPHIGWASREARQALLDQIALPIEHFSQGQAIKQL